jgi:hypothetical protein
MITLLAAFSSSVAFAAVCANADFDLTSLSATGDTTGASDSFEPSCQTNNGADHAYEWIAPATGTYTIDTEGSTHADTVLAVYAADCTTELECSDDEGTGLLSTLTIDAVAGERFLIVVDGYGTNEGAYNLNITQYIAAACSIDLDLGTGATMTSGTTCGAVDDLGDVSCSNTTGSEELTFMWTAPTTESWSFDTSGSLFDTVITVRAASDCAAELACDDDSGVGNGSLITLVATAGVEYAITVEGYTGSAGAVCGDFMLDIYAGCPDSDGDTVCNADDLCDGDDASGDSDFDFICDDSDFTLTAGTPTRGQRLALSVANAEPGSSVVFLLSTRGAGAGPCHPTAGICADILAPVVAGTARANAAGVATFNLPVPPTAPAGATVRFQAAYLGAEADITEVEVRQVQ